MYFKYSQYSNRLQASDALSAYAPQGFSPLETAALKSRGDSPPKPAQQPAAANVRPSGGGIINRVNTVQYYQQLFTNEASSDLPVFLRGGARDVFLYRSAMALSVVGLGIAFYGVLKMANGKMQKK